LLARKSDAGPSQEIRILAREKNIPVILVERTYLDKMLPGIVHQGVVAIGAAKGYLSIDELLLSAGAEPFLFLLPELNDPRNLGAIIRTAEAAGAHGIVIASHRSVSLTPAAIKASAGAFEYVPLCRVTNMVQTIKYLKQKNIWIVGAHPLAKEVFWDSRLDGPVALVIGSEGKGLGPLIRKNCDILVGLPMVGRLNSLNASVAAALLAYEVFRQRRLAAHGRAPDR
ncbi:MAG: 23S rRNA (guanosine(2251)-2'-O)-methyltransferase RlmB, partial [Eubacteriales bacterium]